MKTGIQRYEFPQSRRLHSGQGFIVDRGGLSRVEIK